MHNAMTITLSYLQKRRINALLYPWMPVQDIEQKFLPATFCHIEYHFDNNSVQIKGKVSGDKKSIACFVLPVISKHRESCALEGNTAVIQKGEADVIITASGFDGEPKPIFCLSGGFEAREFTVSPNENGEFSVTITVQ